jgi:hypothetical protein
MDNDLGALREILAAQNPVFIPTPYVNSTKWVRWLQNNGSDEESPEI